ncbi:MAG: AAA family ATPase, partial [Ruminococcus sp.]|nr:AAA family ATPase [Ruminococcus sp.]
MKNTKKIVLSGGPSGGKSKALKRLKAELESLGYNVYAISESATEILQEGFDRNKSPYEFQKAIAENQLKNEKELENVIKDDEMAVIICDRGLMDCRVYLNDEDFERIKSELNMSDVELRDRYDAVFHLDSTSTDENVKYKTGEIRTEPRDEAQKINDKSLRAWCGNPHYRFIPVCESFDEKFDILFREIKNFLGIPKPLEIERKFLIKYPDTEFLISLPCSKSDITQSYLLGKDGKFRLRKRGENGHWIFIKTEKHKISETVREEIETRLSKDEYERLMSENPIIGTISKERYCLMYGGVYYEI